MHQNIKKCGHKTHTFHFPTKIAAKIKNIITTIYLLLYIAVSLFWVFFSSPRICGKNRDTAD